jgi:1,4-dihydroxy-2-naphthoate octaprenyltransferase
MAGIITGNAIAIKSEHFSSGIFILSLLTAIAFQITSNFANDYGDGLKGTDNKNRIGPERALQKGLLTAVALKKGIVVSAIVSFLLAIVLVYYALGLDRVLISMLFLMLALLAIWAAIKYTVGKKAYGYIGLGDLFVFLFFGWVSVMGSFFLQSQLLDTTVFIYGTALGLLSVGVLNLNNMRDINNDKNSNKITLAVLLGSQKAKIYHYFLIFFSGFCLFLGMGGAWFKENPFIALLFTPLIYHLYQLKKTTSPKGYDPLLKQLALSTFAISLFLLIIHTLK